MSTMLPVDAKVYNNRNIVENSYYDKCLKKDIISAIHNPLLNMGYHLDHTGIYLRTRRAVAVDTPWCHAQHLRTKKCMIDHHLKFNVFGYIPPRCMECWKVVVGPRTIEELFKLWELEQELKYPAKCGIELRYYTPRLYGGYFYNNSLDEGRWKYEIVRKAVSEHISPEIPVILKRACTEFEMVKGPSVAWFMSKDEYELDERIDTLIDLTTPNVIGQNEECWAQVQTHWIEWAWKHQDPTVDKFLGGEPLYPSTVTYHEGDLEEIKRDIARAKNVAKHNLDPEITDAVRLALRGFSMTKGLNADKIGDIIGYDSINPLYRGGHDELL